jgi:putative endonuclease
VNGPRRPAITSAPRPLGSRPLTAEAGDGGRATTRDKPLSNDALRRAEARALGKRAERAARAHLVDQGFEIFGANVRVGRYEIDLLARDQSVVVVVEVRARGPGSLVRPLDTVDARKRARLRMAAKRLWLDRFARDLRFDRMRFDCVAVTLDAAGDAHIEHVRAAF